MAWSDEQKRRARFLAGQEAYARECAAMAGRSVEEEWTRFVLEKMPPITFMGTFTFPEWQGADRRRWTLHHFLNAWCGTGHYLAAEEPHKSGKVHFHAVGAEHLRHLSMHDAWRVETGGGYARIEKPRSAHDAVAYCVKYITKAYLTGQGELRLGEPASPAEPFVVRRGFRNPWRPRRPEEAVVR